MKTIPALLLSGCISIQSDVDLKRCSSEVSDTKEACLNADVTGSNKNTELHRAVDNLKKCLAEKVRVVCQDPGLGEVRTLSITKLK